MSAGWRDKIKAMRLPEATVPVVTRGDLAVDHEAAVDELEAARATKSTSLAGTGTAELEDRVRAIEAQMQDSIVPVRLRALPRTKRSDDPRPSWAELKAQHPPRESAEGEMRIEDRMAGGINIETFAEPLVRASIVGPDDLTAEDIDDLLAGVTDRQFDDLMKAAWDLNASRVDVPFWSADSETTPTT